MSKREELVEIISELHEILVRSFDDGAAITVENVVRNLVEAIKELKLLDAALVLPQCS